MKSLIKKIYGIFLFVMVFSFLPGKIFAQVTTTLTASKSYSPPSYQDADTSLMYIARFAIPAEINVISVVSQFEI